MTLTAPLQTAPLESQRAVGVRLANKPNYLRSVAPPPIGQGPKTRNPTDGRNRQKSLELAPPGISTPQTLFCSIERLSTGDSAKLASWGEGPTEQLPPTPTPLTTTLEVTPLRAIVLRNLISRLCEV